MKKYLLMLGMAVAMAFATGSTVEAKTMTVTVKKADTSTLKKVNAHLKKGKKFYLKVKGSKSGSKKLIKSVSTKIGEINGYDVRFNYSSQKKSSKGYYRFTVSANNAKLYRDTIKLLADMYTSEVKVWKDVWNPDLIGYTFDENGNYIEINGDYETVEVSTTYKEEFGGVPFYQLSTLAQSKVIARHFNNETSKYMTYNSKYKGSTDNYTDGKIISKLLNKTMKGVCHDFTNSQIVLFKQIGISAYYAMSKGENHAMPIVKVQNSNNKTMWVCWDYGSADMFRTVKSTSLLCVFSNPDWVIKDKFGGKKLQGIMDEALANTWTWDDCNAN